METMETIRVFLGWCTAINLCLLMFVAIILVGARGPISRLHARMLGMEEREVSREYMQFLGQFKIAFFIFNLVPYFALRIMA